MPEGRDSGAVGGKTAVVVGASRGLGRGIAVALSAHGASVVAIAREPAGLSELQRNHPAIEVVAADATDPVVAGRLLDAHDPDILALVAGASPLLRPLQLHTWETFSLNWRVDVRLAFHWLREALLRPLRPGSRVIVMSSGAATHGSPLSGGYAGAKATLRFIASYASEEARREGLSITVSAVLPRPAPDTDIGRAAIAAYAARAGIADEDFRARMGAAVTPEIAGAAFVALASGDGDGAAYELTGDGLRQLAETGM